MRLTSRAKASSQFLRVISTWRVYENILNCFFQVHKKAYLAALADARAKNLPLRPEHLANRTTRSFTFTYYDSLPWSEIGFSQHTPKSTGDGSKLPPMAKILGKNNNIYDYYPGGKKDPSRRLEVPQRKQVIKE